MDICKSLLCELLGSSSLTFLLLYLVCFSPEKWLMALMMGLFIVVLFYLFISISGSHFLPIISIGFYSSGRMPLHIMILYILTQVIGIFIGINLFIIFYSYNITSDDFNHHQNFQHIFLFFIFSFFLTSAFLLTTGNKNYYLISGIIIGMSYVFVLYILSLNKVDYSLYLHDMVSAAIILISIIVGSIFAGLFYRFLLIEDLPKMRLDID